MRAHIRLINCMPPEEIECTPLHMRYKLDEHYYNTYLPLNSASTCDFVEVTLNSRAEMTLSFSSAIVSSSLLAYSNWSLRDSSSSSISSIDIFSNYYSINIDPVISLSVARMTVKEFSLLVLSIPDLISLSTKPTYSKPWSWQDTVLGCSRQGFHTSLFLSLSPGYLPKRQLQDD